MDNNTKQHFKTLLEKQHSHLSDIINKMKDNETAENNIYTSNELSNYDNHPAELGTQVYQLEFNNAQMVHEEHLLKEVEDALERIKAGTYGGCAFCGRDIGSNRLEAVPHARLCMECELGKAITPRMLKYERPNEELVTDAHVGRKYLNEREDDEHEGIDQFNDLMKYGSSDSPQDMGGYHGYEEFYTNEIDRQGIVDDMDRISNNEYKRQLPD